MAKRIPQTSLDAVIGVVSRFPEGASLDDLLRNTEISFPRRTLQRYAGILVKNEKLTVEGKTSNRRYRLPVSAPVALRKHGAGAYYGQERR